MATHEAPRLLETHGGLISTPGTVDGSGGGGRKPVEGFVGDRVGNLRRGLWRPLCATSPHDLRVHVPQSPRHERVDPNGRTAPRGPITDLADPRKPELGPFAASLYREKALVLGAIDVVSRAERPRGEGSVVTVTTPNFETRRPLVLACF